MAKENFAQNKKKPVKVFVSGCYDIIHAGHIQFFTEARALGNYLIVCFASDEILKKYKGRTAAIPQEHKKIILESLRLVDEVCVGDNMQDPILDFKNHFLRIKPDILVATEDDKNAEKKKALCAQVGAKYVILPKTPPKIKPISTTEIRKRVCE